jgi:NDP-sugar pyrophosphorylase family protein
MLKKAMILAAGFGTRLKPLTDTMPKALVEYNGKPMVSNAIEKLKREGIDDIVINTHHFSDQMEKYFNENSFGVKITLVKEEEILGTGGAVKNAEKYLSDADDFLVYNTDVDSDVNIHEMYQHHINHIALATMAVQFRQTNRPILIDEDMNFRGRAYNSGYEFKKAAFCGIHVMNKNIFRYFPDRGKFDMVDFYCDLVSHPEVKIKCYNITDIYWRDLGKEF